MTTGNWLDPEEDTPQENDSLGRTLLAARATSNVSTLTGPTSTLETGLRRLGPAPPADAGSSR
jgi:hypothetical protein